MNWRLLLPPYNLARWFSFTRQVEAERDYWRDEAVRWQNYALLSRGMPAVSVANEPRVSRPGPPPRTSLLGLRSKQRRIWATQEAAELDGDGMAAVADEYAAKVSKAPFRFFHGSKPSVLNSTSEKAGEPRRSPAAEAKEEAREHGPSKVVARLFRKRKH